MNNVTIENFLQVYVFVDDLGDYTESFNVTAYYSNGPISTQIVQLAAGAKGNLALDWNTSGITPDAYIIDT